MDSINAQAQAQLGGVSHVFFVEHRQVISWPAVVDGQLTSAHVLSTGTQLAQLEGIYATPELSTDSTDTQHGTQFAQQVAGMYAGDAPAVLAQLARMSGRRHLVLVRYYNGTVVAAGDAIGGLLFTNKYASGKAAKDRLGQAWQFAAPTSSPAAYVTQPFLVQGLGLVTPGQPVPNPATGTGTGSVKVYTSKGRYLGTAQAGQTVIITSPFRVTIKIQ